MTIQAQLADGRVLEFPDGTDPQVIQRVVKAQMGQQQEVLADNELAGQEAAESKQPPTVENLAPQQLHNKVIGGLEGALQLGSVVVGEVVGGLTAATDLLNPLTDNDPVQVLNNVKEILRYEPRGVNEDAAVQELASKLEPLKPLIQSIDEFTTKAADQGLDATGSPAVAAMIKSIPTAVGEMLGVGAISRPTTNLPKLAFKNPRDARKALAESILSDTPNVESVTKEIVKGDIVTNKTAKRALNVLEKDLGKDAGVGVVSVIESMSPATKARADKMLSIISRGRKEPLFKDVNRPSDVLGDAVADRAKAIATLNKRAGERIGAVAKKLKGQSVDLSEPIDSFFDKLSGMGVKFEQGDDGWVTPDFSRSKFMGGSQKDMTVLINDLINKTPDFETAHKLKRSIRDNVNYDSIGANQLKGDSEKLLKDLSSEIDSVLDSASDVYKKANDKFAKTIKIKDDFDKMAGKDIDIFSADSSKAFGDKARRLVSNATSRTQINKVINDAEKVLGEFNINFKDDIPALNYLVTKLEDSFKIVRDTSLKGNIQGANINTATALNPQGAALEVALDKVKNLSAPDFNKKMRAYKSLISQGKK